MPTTYAGSEMTPIIGQTEDGVKTTQKTLKVLPETVIYDVDQTLSLREQGISAIFVSHNMHHVHRVSDRIVAMALGETIGEMRTADVTADDLHGLLEGH